MKIFLAFLIFFLPLKSERILPTKEFQKAITYFDKEYETKKPYRPHPDEFLSYRCMSKDGKWSSGSTQLNANVWEITLKSRKPLEGSTYARVTITEFQFSSTEEAKKANTTIKEFSDESWKMKTMNNYFIHGSCIYLIETDAVMFEKDYKSITERLKKYLEV